MTRSLARAFFTLPAIVATLACSADPLSPSSALAPDAPARALSPAGYQATLLPFDYPVAINASGAILGMGLGTAVYHAGGTTRTLAKPASAGFVEAVGLADDGSIVAQYRAGLALSALLYPTPASAPLRLFQPWEVEVFAMNGAGIVAGRYRSYPNPTFRPFIWSAGGSVIDVMPTPLGASAAISHISPDGYLVGTAQFRSAFPWGGIDDPVRFRWTPGTTTGVKFSLQHQVKQALRGGAVLVQLTSNTLPTAIWKPSGLTPVGPTTGDAEVSNISGAGRLVGTMIDPATGTRRAWTAIGNGQPTFLPSPAGALSIRPSAVYVNDCGTIVGVAEFYGRFQAVVWRKMTALCDAGVFVP